MAKQRTSPGRALFYSRDSEGRHETTPAQYINWARQKSLELKLEFDGVAEVIESMIRDRVPVRGDIFFDYGVSGDKMSRPALDRFLQEALSCDDVTHVLIPRRDRLARPNHSEEGVALESKLRKGGLTVVFMDRTLAPLTKRRRADLGETLLATIEYDTSGRFRHDHAQKMLFAQLSLARNGFSTGGRAPYGFRRTLVTSEGDVVRQLEKGEVVRKPGHHVIWLPGPADEWVIIRRILKELETKPASQVAKMLTEEGVPAPDTGRLRTDQGMTHIVSGVWHQSTITNIARNDLLVGVATYGRRSMGDQLRFSPEGPREVTDDEFLANGKPKVVRNPPDQVIKTTTRFEALVEPTKHRELLAELDRRAGSQRGKPRSRDAANNPLGCRIFDMNCTWPMYRAPYNGTFHYKCGLYQQSHAAQCHHNHVNGPKAVRFVLGAIRQRLLSQGGLEKLQTKLRALANAEQERQVDETIPALKQKNELVLIQSKVATVQRNLALAESPDQFRAISAVFNELKTQETNLIRELSERQARQTRTSNNQEGEVEAALALLRRLPALADDAQDFAKVQQLCVLLQVRLYFRFAAVKKKKRTETKVIGGVLTFGEGQSPIEHYSGPTARGNIGSLTATIQNVETPTSEGVGSVVDSEQQEDLLGNVSRGDRTSIELFSSSFRDWTKSLVSMAQALAT